MTPDGIAPKQRTLRILHCLSTHELAGTERHVAELIAHQSTRHEVSLLLENTTRDPLTGGDICDILPPDIRVLAAGRLGYLAQLARQERSGRFDIIHTHLGRASARATWLRHARLWRGTPLVATLHTRYRARSYGLHDGLVCIASWQQASLPSGRKQSSTLIPNWTLPTARTPEQDAALKTRLRREWGLSDDHVVIGAVGRMVPEKNFLPLITAWKAASLPPHVALVMIGDGPERKTLEALAAEDPRVIFTGFRTDMPDALAGLDAFIMPSRHEPFGLALLEAMDAGLPVCATAAGGVLDILHDAPECLVPPDDMQALTQALQRLACAPRRVWDLSGFRLDRQADRLDGFYRSLCRKNP